MKNKKLIDIFQKTKKEIEEYIETLSFGQEKKTAEQAARNCEQVLQKIGYRKPKEETKSEPRTNPFKKKKLTPGEKHKYLKIDNSDAPENPFKRKEKKEEKKIDNSSAPKKDFRKKEKPAIAAQEDKNKPKGKRILKNIKLEILSLHEEGKTPSEISDLVWVEQKAIEKVLGIKPKKKKSEILLADNQKEGIEGFIDEVNKSK